MALSDAERFAEDLKNNPDLAQMVKENATGLASLVDIAKSKGYDFSVDDAKEFIQARVPQELTDDQMNAVAGGKSSTGSTVAQTTAVASTAAEAAEVATSAVQVAEAATDAAAAAEVVVVAAAAVVLT